ncbi:hypothetical protein, partial [Paenibacillus barengoltzii]|uniref:Uncharacterized protein n=1 Tax=Paenibacillus barengoltzii G22 TaxID=1235795 RepID=R9LEI4_9BACL
MDMGSASNLELSRAFRCLVLNSRAYGHQRPYWSNKKGFEKLMDLSDLIWVKDTKSDALDRK